MDNKLIGNENNIVFYTDEEGNLQIEVVLQDENVWLNVNTIAELFDVQRPAIVKHINNIYNEQELDKDSTCSILEQVAAGSSSSSSNILPKCLVMAWLFTPNNWAICACVSQTVSSSSWTFRRISPSGDS